MVCSFDSAAKPFRERSENPKTVLQSSFFSQRYFFSSQKISGKMECKFNCLLNECLSNLRKRLTKVWKHLWEEDLIKLKLFPPGQFFLGKQNSCFQSWRIVFESTFFVQMSEAKVETKNSLQIHVFPQKICGHVDWNFGGNAKNFSKNSEENPH